MIPVLISESALRDLEDVWAFVAQESAESATGLLRPLLERAFRLGEFPNAARETEGLPETRRVNVRALSRLRLR